MNRWLAIAVIALVSGLTGWSLGLSQGERERRAILADLPEERAYWEKLDAKLGETGDRGRVCNRIFDLVNEHEAEARRLEMMDEPLRVERD